MKYKYMMMLALLLVLLAGCSGEEKREGAGSVSDGESSGENSALEHGVTDQTQTDIGFGMNGSNIEEAQNVPETEKKALLETFDTYMTAFNEENIEKYMSTISKEPEGFDYNEEQKMLQDTFAEFKINRTAEDVTIIKYDKKHAQVFAKISTSLEQEKTGAKLDRNGRQVTVFVKEEGNWRVTSVYFIGDATE